MIKNSVSGYQLSPDKIGFKSYAPMLPIPGVVLPNQEQETNQYQQVPTQNELPDIYYMPDKYKKKQSFLDVLKKVDLFGLVVPWIEHPLLSIGVATGISAGIDAFDKSCNKEYEQSIVGRAAKFGDKIEKSEFVQKEGTRKFLGGIKNGWHKIKATLMKSDVIKAMVETPSSPEWSTPKQELKNTNFRLVNKFKELATKIGLVPTTGTSIPDTNLVSNLNDLVLNKEEREYIKNTYSVSKITKAPKEESVNRIMLKRLGKSEQEISSILSSGGNYLEELIKKSGLSTEELEKIFKDETGETINLVEKASKNLMDIKVANGKFVLPCERQPFVNVESPRGIYNRIHSMTDGAETKTGRFMSKLVQKLHKMFTFGSNKLAVLIWITPIMTGTIINTIKADKKEKVGTAANGIITAFAWVLYFPLVLKAVYALGGMQYAGMSKENVEEMKRLIREFNEKTIPGGEHSFQNINEYKSAKDVLKKKIIDLRKVKNQNFLTKTLRGLSKFAKSDLLKIESYKGGSAVGNFLRAIPNKAKDLFLGRGRLLIFMAAAVPFVDKIIEKISTKIFGKGYDEFKDSDMKAEKEAQEQFTMKDLKDRLIKLYQNKLNPAQEIAEQNNPEVDPNLAYKTIIPASMAQMVQNSELNNQNPADKIADAEISGNPILEQNEDSQNNAVNPLSPAETENEPAINNSNPQQKPITDEMNPNDNISNEPSENGKVPSNLYDNGVEPRKSDHPDMLQQKPKRDNYTYIPSSENVLKNNSPTQPMNKYIPAQTPAVFAKTFDNSGLEAALRRADRAEKRALDVLAGNF